MEQVKIFTSTVYSDDAAESFEEQINDWLSKNSKKIKIIREIQTTSGNGIDTRTVISIFYKKK